jgi:sugar lactone lactonase YvrE
MEEFFATSVPKTTGDLGEGILWDERSSTLLWADVFKKLILRWNPETKKIVEKEFENIITYIGKYSQGGFVVAAGDSIAILDDNLNIQQRVPLSMPNLNVRTNDGNIDALGNLWIGSMSDNGKLGQGDLKRVAANWAVSTELKNISISNGMDWSPDAEVFYFIDTPTRKVRRFNFDGAQGTLKSELEPLDVSGVSGSPDGMCVDRDGNLWIAFWGGGCVRKYSPQGEILGIVHVPATLVTNCTFGGNDLATLYITTANTSHDASIKGLEPLAGSLFEVEVGALGLPANNLLS